MPAQAVTAAPLPAQLFSVAVYSPGLNGLDQSILENNQFILNMKKNAKLSNYFVEVRVTSAVLTY